MTITTNANKPATALLQDMRDHIRTNQHLEESSILHGIPAEHIKMFDRFLYSFTGSARRTDEKADVLLDKASTPEVLAAHFRKAAQQYLEDASELRAMWQDATAGLIWETIGRDLDKLADKIDRAWSRT